MRDRNARRGIANREGVRTMTTSSVDGEIQFHCDVCPEYVDTEEQDFGEALAMVKEAGWRAVKISNQWEHRCPSCVEDETTKKRNA